MEEQFIEILTSNVHGSETWEEVEDSDRDEEEQTTNKVKTYLIKADKEVTDTILYILEQQRDYRRHYF
eukprot:TRINITY_DN135568_c0_g1_i1.p2 TRINITY_DN135568_c0_g1~~TRINITY_DN135568_c0_g1_i1.p2  ORF type:complete len:68 (+),score=14.45 TRINITY_DN135568_c0_g1_i1:103-306(+)